jgi:hypothetical protein
MVDVTRVSAPDTYNHVEGFHSKLNKWCDKVHPDVYSLINLFKSLDSCMINDYTKRIDKTECTKRDPNIIARYESLSEYHTKLRNDELSLQEYLEKASTTIDISTIITTDRDDSNQERIDLSGFISTEV